jgi:arylsulfatase A-like enzyme
MGFLLVRVLDRDAGEFVGSSMFRIVSISTRIAILALVGSVAHLASAQDGSKSNVLLIFADDVGRDAIGCYGGESYATPHIDQLARTGMRFDHAYSHAVCHPSRICLMTGQYPARLGNPKWGSFPAEAEAYSIGSTMKSAGYATAVAGKWQLCLMKNDLQQPARMGFDEWAVFGWHEGARYRSPMIYHSGEVMPDTEGKFGPDLYVDFLIDFMKRSKEEGKPFFAYYPMALAHDVTDDIGEPVPFYADGKWQTFGEMVESMDDMVGRLIGALEELELREDTLVIYTTDNGSPKASYLSVGADGKFTRPKVVSKFRGRDIPGGKGELTDWGTRVPLIANWPGRLREATSSNELIDFADFLPTLAEFAGAPLDQLGGDAVLDGSSFLPLLVAAEGKALPERDKNFAYAEHSGRQFVRNHDWKLYSDGSFYDLRDGVDERTVKPSKIEDLDDGGKAAHAELSVVLAGLPKAQGKTKPKASTKKPDAAEKSDQAPGTLPVPGDAVKGISLGEARILFDGKTLNGWQSAAGAWEVRDGAIWCTGRKDGGKNWLIYRGDTPDDFVLELEYQFEAGNSGVQVRSAEIEPFQVRGYQVEIAEPEKMGLWHHSLSPAKYRSHLATAGQSTVYSTAGEKTVTEVHPAEQVQSHVLASGSGKWNQLKITVRGDTFVQEVNGSWLATLTDLDAEHSRSSGVIALQDHGKGTIAAYRNIRLAPVK